MPNIPGPLDPDWSPEYETRVAEEEHRVQRNHRGRVVAGVAAALLVTTGAVVALMGGGDSQANDDAVADDPTEGVVTVPETTTPSETTTTTEAQVESREPANMQLAWEWEPSMGLDVWNVATPALEVFNNEEQVYQNSPENVRVENGVLVLEAHRNSEGFSSGRVSTEGVFSVGVGSHIEATMKLPKGAGTWPAFWMLSADNPNTQGFSDADWETPIENSEGEPREAYMLDGEVDIMEAYGTDEVEGTVHTIEESSDEQLTVPGASEEFHTYAIDFGVDEIVWSVDGEPYHTFEKTSDNPEAWPFGDGNFYLILNFAMGGDPGPVEDGPGDWKLNL